MIDFKTHIELFKGINKESGVSTYLDKLDPLERLKTNRSIEETYPIQDSKEVTEYVKSNFNVTLSVDDAVLGQFIMLEQIITGKTKFQNEYDRDLAFAKLIIRPKHHKEFDNENLEDEAENEQMILSSPVQDIYNVINRYLDNRDFVLFKQFSGVFYEMTEDDNDEQEEGREEDKTAENLFHQQWYWYSIVRKLANEDITKYNEIYMLKMATVLPEMSYLAQREKIEGAQRRQAQAMNKL
jgi:hypothetical protein